MAQPAVSFEDVTIIIRLVADLRDDVRMIRELLLEDEDGEEEDPEADG